MFSSEFPHGNLFMTEVSNLQTNGRYITYIPDSQSLNNHLNLLDQIFRQIPNGVDIISSSTFTILNFSIFIQV